ncbi:MAG: signal recognition particle-docking protein FtsY [Hyphomicrobiaceae bacterium]|nr:signal recognition particle-docking protein FtsY [Hyphomicrobiaceae bacterium]
MKPKKAGLFDRLLGRGEQPVDNGPRELPVGLAVPSEPQQSEPQQSELTAPAVEELAPPEAPPASESPKPKGSWFDRLKAGLTKTSSKLSEGITGVFAKRKLDAGTLDELEDLLIQADLGLETAARITDALAKGRYDKGISPDEVRAVLATEIEKVLTPVAKPLVPDPAARPHVILTVGVNGTGKTTTIGKLAARYVRSGKKVMLVAGDTFRAAAIEQLEVWGRRAGATVVARDVGADAAGLAFDALTQARRDGYDVLLVDTAGRLQNKKALMDELAKVIRVMKKIDPSAPHDTLLVLDATTGQNALDQVRIFQEQADVSGLVMTKLDGTARGGILVAIAARYGIPVHAAGVGEGIDDLQAFDAGEFARAIALA